MSEELFLKIKEVFRRDDKYSRRMERCIEDISLHTGMGIREILDFLRFGAEEELARLDESFDWNQLTKSISKKLNKK